MKPSRWNIFARLTSRRQNQDTSNGLKDDSGPAAVEDTQPPPSSPLPGEAYVERLAQESPSDVEDATPTADAVEDQVPIKEADLSADLPTETLDQIGSSDHQEAKAPALTIVAENEARDDKPKRRRSTKPQPSVRDSAAPTEPHAPKEVEPPAAAKPVRDNPFLAEVTGLDEEVKQLRQLLAQKLRAQNTQLKKMLERFERS